MQELGCYFAAAASFPSINGVPIIVCVCVFKLLQEEQVHNAKGVYSCASGRSLCQGIVREVCLFAVAVIIGSDEVNLVDYCC